MASYPDSQSLTRNILPPVTLPGLRSQEALPANPKVVLQVLGRQAIPELRATLE